MSKVQTAVVVILVGLAALVAGVSLLARKRVAHRADLLRNKARDIRERMESDRIEVARRQAEAARIGARAQATQLEDDEAAPADVPAPTASEPAAVSGSSADQADLAERLRYADEIDPELPNRVVAERERETPAGGDVH